MSQMPPPASSKRLSRRELQLRAYLESQPKTARPVRVAMPQIPSLRRITLDPLRRVIARVSAMDSLARAVVLGGVVGGVAFGVYMFFTVRTVQVLAPRDLPAPLHATSELIGTSMLTQSSEDLETRLLEANPNLATARVSKLYPQTIQIEPRLAEAVLYLSVSDSLILTLDHRAKVIGSYHSIPPSTPRLTYYQQLVNSDYDLGTVVPYGEIQMACQVAALLRRYAIMDYTIQIEDRTRITVNTSSTQYLLSYKDSPRQLTNLEQILRVVTRGEERYRSVDFRFERVITEK